MNRLTKTAGLALISALWAGSAGASAAAPVDARRLGLDESMLKYCQRTDPPDAARLQKKIQQMLADAPDRQTDSLRKTTEYRTAYDAVTDFVAKVDDHNASRACRELLTRRK